MRGAASSSGASGAHSRARSFALVLRIFSHVVLELRLGVERLRGRGGDHWGGGGAAQAASPASIAQATRMRRFLDICKSSSSARAAPGAGKIAESRDSINSAQLSEHCSRPTWCDWPSDALSSSF